MNEGRLRVSRDTENHGAAMIHAPSQKFARGSQSASATSAARLMVSAAYPQTQRFQMPPL